MSFHLKPPLPEKSLVFHSSPLKAIANAENQSDECIKSDFDPLHTRISTNAVCKMFELDIKFCFESIKNNTHSNQQKLMNISLFKKPWEKFGPFLPRLYFATRLIECGEELMNIHGYHNLAETFCFSRFMSDFDLNSFESPDSFHLLQVRAEYGLNMAAYLRIIAMDPCIKSTKGLEETEKVLKNLIQTMNTCFEQEEKLAAFLLNGTFHIRLICDHLNQNQNSTKAIPFMKKMLYFLECCISLAGVDYLEWLLNNVIATHRMLVSAHSIAEANNIILSTLHKVDLIHELEKEARATDLLPKSVLDVLGYAYHELNLILFGCEVRYLSNSILVPSTDSEKPSEKGKEDKEYKMLKIGQHGDVNEVSRLRKTSAYHWDSQYKPISSRKEFVKDAQAKMSVLLSYSKPKKIYSLFKIHLTQETHEFHPKENYMKELSELAKIQLEIKQKSHRVSHSSMTYSNELMNQREITPKSKSLGHLSENPPAKGSRSVRDSPEDSQRKEKIKISYGQKGPASKTKAALEENEELRVRKLEFRMFVNRLQVFESDQLKLQAILEALNALGLSSDILLINERPNEKEDLWIRRLLDFGFTLLISTPNFFSEFIKMSHIREYHSNKLSNTIRAYSPHEFQYLDRLSPKNVLKLANFAYIYGQSSRFKEIYALETNGLIKIDSIKDASLKLEMNLRSTAQKFYVSLLSERKVGFEKVEKILSVSLFDLKAKRLLVPDNLQSCAIQLISCLNDCIKNESFPKEYYKIIVGTTLYLWKFVEPFLGELLHTKDEQAKSLDLQHQSILHLSVRTIYLILSQFPTQEMDLGIQISRKLSLLYECLEYYNQSVEIIQNLLQRIRLIRHFNGESGNTLGSITASTHLHLSKWSHSNSHNANFFANLACIQADVQSALYRCQVKSQYKKLVDDARNKEEQHFRLTQKRITVSLQHNESDIEDNCKAWCGDNETNQALYLIVIAANATYFSNEIRKSCLQKAFEKIHSSYKNEKNMIHALKTSDDQGPINVNLLYKTHDTISLIPFVIDTSNQYYYQVFCSCHVINSKISVTNAKLNGSGELLHATSEPFRPISITHLIPNAIYSVAAQVYDSQDVRSKEPIYVKTMQFVTEYPIPLLLCWGYLTQIACDLSIFEVAEPSFQILWNYYVKSFLSDKDLMKLSNKKYIESESSLYYTLNQTRIQEGSKSIAKTFIQSLFSILQGQYNLMIDSHNSKNGNYELSMQLFRLKACHYICIAMEISSLIQDEGLEILAAIKCITYLEPLLKTQVYHEYIIQVLLAIQKSIKNSISALGNDRIQGVMDYYVPVIYHLSKALIQSKALVKAMSVFEDALSFISKTCPIKDNKIPNSHLLDQSWGTNKYGKTNGILRLSSSTNSEFFHHELHAISNHWKTGYDMSARNRLDEFCEYLDSMFVHCKYRLAHVKESHEEENGNATKTETKKEVIKRNFDSSISIKDILTALENNQSPDSVFHELGKFKKNSRFVELTSKVVQWSKENRCHDFAIRICLELDDWLKRRNQAFLSFDMTKESGSKWDLNKKKKQSNHQSTKTMNERGRSTQRAKSNGRDSSESSVERYKSQKRKQVSKSKEALASGRSSRSVSPTSGADTPNGDKASTAESIYKLSYFNKKTEVNSSGLSKEETQARLAFVASKRKRLAAKQQFYNTLTENKDIIEKAAKTLDKKLSCLWHRNRIRRRHRLVLEYEAQSRVDIALTHSESLLISIKKELGHRYLSKSLIYDVKSVKDHTVSDAKNLEEDQLHVLSHHFIHLIEELLKRTHQSITLARRYLLWKSLLKGIHHLVKVYTFLKTTNLIQLDICKSRIWKIINTAAEDVIDFMQTIDIVLIESEKDEENLEDYPVGNSRRVDYDKFLPIKSVNDVYNKKFAGIWKENEGTIQIEHLDVVFITRFLGLVLESNIRLEKKVHENDLVERLSIFYAGQLDVLNYQKEQDTSTDSLKMIEFFEKAIATFQKESQLESLITTMHELGDYHLTLGNKNEATYYWSKSLDILYQTGKDRLIPQWKSILNFESNESWIPQIRDCSLNAIKHTGSIKFAFLAGILGLKIVQSFASNKIDKKQQLTLFSVINLMSPLLSTIPVPSSFIDFQGSYQPQNLSAFLETFMSQFKIEPNSLVSLLQHSMRQLLTMNLPSLVFPLSSIVNYISKSMITLSLTNGITKLLRIEALFALDKKSEAILKLYQLRLGTDLDHEERLYKSLDLHSHRITANELEKNPFLLVDEVSKSFEVHQPTIYGPLFAQCLDLSTIRLLVYTFIDSQTQENLTVNAKKVEKCLLGKLSELKVLKTKGTNAQLQWIQALEIEWMSLIALYNFKLKRYALSCRWLPSLFTYLHNFEQDAKAIGFPILSDFNSLWLQSREMLGESFRNIQYALFSKKLSFNSQKEAESMDSIIYKYTFKLLETRNEDRELDSSLFAHDLKTIHNYGKDVSFCLESIGDYIYKSKHITDTHGFVTDIYKKSLDAFTKTEGYKNPNVLLRLNLKIFKLTKKQKYLENSFDIYHKEDCISDSLLFCLVLNECKYAIETGYLMQDTIISKLKDLIKDVLESQEYFHHIFLEALALLVTVLPTTAASQVLIHLTRIKTTFHSFRLLQKNPFQLNLDSLSPYFLQDIDAIYQQELCSQIYATPLEASQLESLFKNLDLSSFILNPAMQSQDLLPTLVKHVYYILDSLDAYWPLTDNVEWTHFSKLNQLITSSDSIYDGILDGFELESIYTQAVPPSTICIQWIAQDKHASDTIWNPNPVYLQDNTLYHRIQNESQSSKFYKAYKLESIKESNYSFECTSSIIPLHVLNMAKDYAEYIILSLRRFELIKDASFKNETNVHWFYLIQLFYSFFRNVKDLKSCPRLSVYSATALRNALDIGVGSGYSANLIPDFILREKDSLFACKKDDASRDEWNMYEWMANI